MPEASEQAYSDKLHLAVKSLIVVLASRDGMLRQLARRSLVAIGTPALEALAEALHDDKKDVRWEAAKALGELRDPAVAPALATALEDESFGVRWLAAEGLIALERRGLRPLLETLESTPDSTWLREGAHHVLRVLANRGLHSLVGDLVAALERGDDDATIVSQSHEILNAMSEEEAAQEKGAE